MASRALERIYLKGYKSIQEMDLPLNRVNILIGANGAGKSNFIGLFKFLNQVVNQNLHFYVAKAGGANQFLHYGQKMTSEMKIETWFASGKVANGYSVTLEPTVEDSLFITEEIAYFHDRARYPDPYQSPVNIKAHNESLLPEWAKRGGVAGYVYSAMRSWQLYHFHDTSESAGVKQTGDIHDNVYLRPDASNLAAYLYLLREKQPPYYRNIVETIRLAAPFFDEFALRKSPFNEEKIRLEWNEKGSDMPFGANALSDGTLRFICLATLFLQPPDNLPATIVLDEPELGLHPYAISLLAEMVQGASEHTQIILATQSVTLVNQFSPENIIVVDREEGKTKFRRFDESEIANWLEDYGIGDLWEKNLLGGRPAL